MPLRRPLQVWLPRRGVDLSKAPTLDHVQYAYCAYQGEGVVRFDGTVTTASRRLIDGTPFWERTVPGETGTSLVVEVFHIGRNGYVWGPDCADRFPNSCVEGLLQAWLSFEPRGGAESADAWASPLANLLPAEGPGPAESRLRTLMVEIDHKASGADALRAATDLAFPYVMEAYGSWRNVVVEPTWVEKGRDHAWLLMESKKLVPRDPDVDAALSRKSPSLEARPSAQLTKRVWLRDVASQVPVRRCWGVPGLFWALLVDHFERRCGFNRCERCSQPLPTSRTHCGFNDDPACFREGLRDRKRSSRRARRSTQAKLGSPTDDPTHGSSGTA
jgi:hypothetical protein